MADAVFDPTVCAINGHRIDTLTERDEDHEKRLRVLEQAHWRAVGVIAGASAAASLAGALLSKLVTP